MFFYSLVLLTLLLLAIVIRPKRSTKAKRLYVALVFALLICIAACRSYTVGVDTEQFIRAYARIGAEGWSAFALQRYEPGFTALCLLLNQLSSNYQLLLVFTAIVMYVPIGYAIYKYSENPLLSCFLFITLNIYTAYMNVMRQGIAAALLVVAFVFLLKRSNVGFVACVVAASMFHVYALIALVILPLTKIGFRKGYVFVYLALYAICLLAFNVVLALAQWVLGREDVYSSDFMASNYFGAVIQLAFVAVLAFFVVNYIEVLKRTNLDDRGMLSFYQHAMMLAVLFQVTGVQAEIFARLAYYFSIFAVISIPIALTAPKQKERTFSLVFLCSMSFAYFFAVGLLRPEWQGVIPYAVDFSNVLAILGW